MTNPIYEVKSKAKRQVESGNAEGAVRTLETFLEGEPDNSDVRMLLARVLIYDLKRMDEGIAQLNVILDLEPDDTDAMKAAVTVLMRDKKNNKRTISLFERLMSVDEDAEVFNLYAKFLRVQKTDFKTSAEYYEKAISLDPKNPDYHQNYAVLLLNDLRDYVKAKSELEILMGLDPDNTSAKKNYDLLLKKKFDKDGNPKKKGLFRR